MDGNERKKVLYLITKSNWGGAQKYVYDISMNLPHDRFEAMVAGGGDGMLFAKLRDAGIRTAPVRGLQKDARITSEWRSFWEIVHIFKRERPDIVHLNSSKAGALGAVAAFIFPPWKLGFRLGNRVSKCRPLVIFTVHGWPFKEDRPFYQRAAIFLTSWLTAILCDRVILVNTADRKTAAKFLSKKKLRLIRNGLAPVDFLPRADARAVLAQKIGRPISHDTLLIGTIAELTKNKGLDYLVDAVNQIKFQVPSSKFQVIIIGDGEEKENLKKQICLLGLNDTIFLTGFIPDASRYLMALDIFVLPSLKEGLPYVVMEAMAAGLPVVATRAGGVPDIITDGEDGLLAQPKDPKAIAQALTRLMMSPGARSCMSERARQKIETRFSFSAMIRDTISLYDHDTPPPPQ